MLTDRIIIITLSLVIILNFGSYQYNVYAQVAANSGALPNTLSSLFNEVKNSVVQINVLSTTINPHLLVSDKPTNVTISSSGSGFIYDNDGHIVTDDHVVKGSNTITIRFLDGNSYSAKIIGEDPYSDLAVLELDPAAIYQEQSSTPLALANSSSVQVGEPVIAIGNPLGLTGSMSQGIISQINRVKTDAITGRFLVSGLIQTDAIITHGNSGGPLIDMNGSVVGVTERGQPSEEAAISFPGIGFAISSDTVKRVVPQLISHGSYQHAWLGVHLIDITPHIAERMGLSISKGVVVEAVTPGSPAQLQGISAGTKATVIDNMWDLNSDADIIIGIDGKQIKDASDLVNYIDSKSPGNSVVLHLFRGDKLVHDINLKLGVRPGAGNFTDSLAFSSFSSLSSHQIPYDSLQNYYNNN